MLADKIRSYKKYVPPSVWRCARSVWRNCTNIALVLIPRHRVLSYQGFTIHYIRGNSLVERLSREPVFEERMCTAIVRDLHTRTHPIFLDVGANIGLISAYVLRQVDGVRVFAFEPGPTQTRLLRDTITTNSLEERWFLYTCALSDTTGEQTFYVHPNRDYAKDGLRDTKRGEQTTPIIVPTETLDTWWKQNECPQVSVVKIDTEGAELLILRGAREFLHAVRPVLYLEIEPTNLRAYPYTAEDILAELETCGYRLETLDGEVVTHDTLARALEREDTFRAVPTYTD